MAASKYERFVVRKPLRDQCHPGYGLTYMSAAQIPEANLNIRLNWVYDTSQAHGYSSQQVLNDDQLLLHIGMSPDTPQALGGTVEFQLGGQPIVFNTTTSVFIPKGTPFGPLSWKEIRRPHVQLAITFGNSNSRALDQTAAGSGTFDYEQYVIRSPLREAGPPHVDGRQNPTMTYLSRPQINAVNNYIEFGWIWDPPNPDLPKMRHDNYDEIVLHIGSDPENPEALGGALQFGLGEEFLEFDTTHCVYAPRGTDHGPLRWKEVRRPLIELAMMLGAGTLEEGWANSFFDQPDGSRRGPK
ncbi:MAG: hypothetical protein GXX84_00065 [Acidobacteria bacterium]|nr:hypothetical protein [Acidobacteriota bacterium]